MAIGSATEIVLSVSDNGIGIAKKICREFSSAFIG
jgi:hypothetical protein